MTITLLPLIAVCAAETATFLPIKSTNPISFVPSETVSVLNEVFNTLISKYFSNFSTGVNSKVFLLNLST